MTREEAITLIKSAQLMLINPITNEPVSDLYEALDMAIQALSQEPCTDAVSRENAVRCVLSSMFLAEASEKIEKLPSVTQKSGKWNEYYTSQKGNDVFNCKECGHTFVVTQGKDNMNFCPNCGCRMVESQESEDKE